MAETWRRVWGDGKNFRRSRFLDDVFFGKNFWWPFFSHRPGFSDFSFLFPHFLFLHYGNCRRSYMTLSSQEKHLFWLCSYFRAHPTTLLLKILGGLMHGPSPYLKLWGDRPPSPPRSLPLHVAVHLHVCLRSSFSPYICCSIVFFPPFLSFLRSAVVYLSTSQNIAMNQNTRLSFKINIYLIELNKYVYIYTPK